MNALSDEIFSLYARYPGIMAILASWVKCTALISLAWGLGRLLHHHSAVVRTWVWRSCFVAMFLLILWPHRPALLSALAWEVQVPTEAVVVSYSSLRKQPEIELLSVERGPLVIELDRSLGARVKRIFQKLDPWVMTVVWSVFDFLAVLRLFRAKTGLYRLISSSRPASDEVRAACERVAAKSKVRSPQVRVCTPLVSPLLTGWRNPFIWLPEESETWNASKLNAVLHHEVAHWVRADGPWQWFVTLTTCFWWWNPVAWKALSRLKAETEQAADERVLSQKVPAADYAQALIEIASSWLPKREPALGVPMLGVSEIEKRVRELLRDNPWRGRVGAFASTSVTLLAVIMSGVVLVSCKQKAPTYVSIAKLVAGGRMVAGGSQANAIQYQDYIQDFYGTIIETVESSEMRRRALDRLRALHPDMKETPVEVKVTQNKGSAIFNVAAKGADPKFTKTFLDCLLDEFVAFRNQIREQQRNKALTTLSEDLVRREKSLQERQEKLTDFQKEHNVVLLSGQNNEYAKQLQDLRAERRRLEFEVIEQEAEFEDIDGAIEDRDFNTESGVGVSGRGAAGGLSLIEKDFIQNKLNLVKLHAEKELHAETGGVSNEHQLQIAKLEALIKHEGELIKKSMARSIERKKARIRALSDDGEGTKKIEEAAVESAAMIATHESLLKDYDDAKRAYDELLALIRRFTVNEDMTSDHVTIMERASPAVMEVHGWFGDRSI